MNGKEAQIKTAPNPLILFPQVCFALNEGVLRGYEPISKKKRCNTTYESSSAPLNAGPGQNPTAENL